MKKRKAETGPENESKIKRAKYDHETKPSLVIKQQPLYDYNSCVFTPLVPVQAFPDFETVNDFIWDGQVLHVGDDKYLMKLAKPSEMHVEDQARKYLLLVDEKAARKYCEFWYPIADQKSRRLVVASEIIEKSCPKTFENITSTKYLGGRIPILDVRISPRFVGINLWEFSRSWLQKSRTKLLEKQMFTVVKNVVEALEFLSRHYVFHSDLNFQNILVNNESIIKIIDFGRALIFNRDPGNWRSLPRKLDMTEWKINRETDSLFNSADGNYMPPELYVPFYNKTEIAKVFQVPMQSLNWIDFVRPVYENGWQQWYGFSRNYVFQSNMYMFVYGLRYAEILKTLPDALQNLLTPFLKLDPKERPDVKTTINGLTRIEKALYPFDLSDLTVFSSKERKEIESKKIETLRQAVLSKKVVSPRKAITPSPIVEKEKEITPSKKITPSKEITPSPELELEPLPSPFSPFIASPI